MRGAWGSLAAMPPSSPPSPATALHAALAVRELAAGARDLLGAFESLRRDGYPWLLDSALPDGRLGRWSFCGSDPWLVLRASGASVALEPRRDVGFDAIRALREADPSRGPATPLDALRALLGPTPEGVGGAPPFAGGLVAVLGHELAAALEPGLAFHGEDELGLPDLVALAVDRVLALDHATGRVVASGLGFGTSAAAARARAEAAAATLAARVAPGLVAEPGRAPSQARSAHTSSRRVGPIASRFDVSSYAKLVDAAKQRIAAGDVYQVCLTHRLEARFPGDPWSLYRALRRESPAPFASFLALPEATLVGASPERFLRVEPDGRVETRPMKGTRPRGASPDADARLRGELLAAPKDRAENVMIVDLARNDLGRVCEIGSIEVPELFAIESYATVHQMVSTVTGRLRRDRDALDAVAAAFPPGSMTGAPKRAALQILDRLEPVRRGPYGGALGWLDARGGADLAVSIRSAIVREGRACFGAGGGIVADSDAAAEWHETLDKARAFARALETEAETETEVDAGSAAAGQGAGVFSR